MFRLGVLVLFFAGSLQARPGVRRALLVGINDYSASRLPALSYRAVPGRDIPNLDGTVNDVAIMRDLLVAIYGFRPAEIVTLTDQKATRDAILRTLDHHLRAASHKGDVAFFYFSGHGSQVQNSQSSEADRLDESLVPADSRRGAPDIRDKELLSVFNSIIDRGARLTIVLDTCHSGSGARGLDGGLRHRGVKPDSRDVADPFSGPAPERRGALILSAAQDSDLAFETLDEQGKIRGAFSWALARAMRDADAGESASDTFLRARALLQAERPSQYPVIAGSAKAQGNPLLGMRSDRRNHRAVIAVEKAIADGTYLLQGGWTSGVTAGSELRLAGRNDLRLEVTSLLGVSHSTVRVTRGAAHLRPGALLEIVTWAAPPSPPLRVWIPRAQQDVLAVARVLRDEATHRGIRWIDDPTEETPAHLLRWRDGMWELVADGRRSKVGAAILAGVPAGASLFVQLPASTRIDKGIGSVNGVELTAGPETADYVLAGRLRQDHIEYAWVRPSVTAGDRVRSILPLRTAWTDANKTFALRDAVVRLRTVQAWQQLRSPTASTSGYRLAIRHASDGTLVEDGKLLGDAGYRLVLRRREQGREEPLFARYVYAFVIDSDGRSTLLFPPLDTGSVENLLPITATPGQALREAPDEIPLDGARPFIVDEPYGNDTYFLLATDEPLPRLADLEWNGVRGPRGGGVKSPLEDLLSRTLAGTRAPEPIRTPPNWSLDKVVFESVPPRRTAR